MHRLTLFRRQIELTIRALAQITGLDERTLLDIERVPGHRVNYTTAEIIANALNCKIPVIFTPEEITQVGRPALSGKPTRKGEEDDLDWKDSGKFCANCFTLLPIKEHEECPHCGYKEAIQDPRSDEDEE